MKITGTTALILERDARIKELESKIEKLVGPEWGPRCVEGRWVDLALNATDKVAALEAEVARLNRVVEQTCQFLELAIVTSEKTGEKEAVVDRQRHAMRTKEEVPDLYQHLSEVGR